MVWSFSRFRTSPVKVARAPTSAGAGGVLGVMRAEEMEISMCTIWLTSGYGRNKCDFVVRFDACVGEEKVVMASKAGR